MAPNVAEALETDITVNPTASRTRELLSFLALINAYVPEFHLPMQQCQQILGPPDPIHGGPPFEQRMKPFTSFIKISRKGVSMDQEIAQETVEKLPVLKTNRSKTVKKLMVSLCGAQTEQCVIQLIKKMLTKREMRNTRKEQFSRLITDIKKKERFHHAVSVLEMASDKFQTDPYYPQTISRLYHKKDTTKAEEWAREAIERAPTNSYMADTLAQVYKKRLIHANEDILRRALEAFKEFKNVEMKAENEIQAEIMPDTFNNRGLYGCTEVAKLAFDKLKGRSADIYPDVKTDIEDKFVFFEWYLTYSKPGISNLEPPFFWKNVALCYEYYTNRRAADSTSFPGLFDLLNHGLFMSKGRRARFEEPEQTVSDLETIQQWLRAAYEERGEDIKLAESYILSNILLSNKMPDSSTLIQVNELKNIIHTFLGGKKGSSRPEFFLLVLLLFWPENQNDEEAGQKAKEDSETADSTREDNNTDEEQNRGTPAHIPADLMLDLNLQHYVTLMEEAFEQADYAKYLRGRYLLPLFFLGKGSGLSKWIHKSRLDAIVEQKVDSELHDQKKENIDLKEKVRRINDLWCRGKVWHIPEIRDILLPVQIERNEEQEVCVCAGGQNIKAREEAQPVLPPTLSYLGFTIQGPVVFSVGVCNSDHH